MNNISKVLHVLFTVALLHSVHASESERIQLDLSTAMTIVSTSQVYTATLQSESMLRYFCEKTFGKQVVAIDAPTIYTEIIKYQSNSLVAIMNKVTGEKFISRAKVTPAIKVWYDKDGMAVGFVLLKNPAKKHNILNVKLETLRDKVISWKNETASGAEGAVSTPADNTPREQLKLLLRQDGFDLQFSYLQLNNQWHLNVDLDFIASVNNRLKHDFIFTNVVASEIRDISDKDTDKFIAIAYSIILNDLVKTRNNISDLRRLYHEQEAKGPSH